MKNGFKISLSDQQPIEEDDYDGSTEKQ